jgi:uncharacterized membrane protein
VGAASTIVSAQQSAGAAVSTLDPLSTESMGIVFWVLLNGVTFATYNLMSYFVLHRTDLITHSVLNVFRRVFTISLSAVFFNVALNMTNAVGISIAIVGVIGFAYFKSKDPK